MIVDLGVTLSLAGVTACDALNSVPAISRNSAYVIPNPLYVTMFNLSCCKRALLPVAHCVLLRAQLLCPRITT